LTKLLNTVATLDWVIHSCSWSHGTLVQVKATLYGIYRIQCGGVCLQSKYCSRYIYC